MNAKNIQLFARIEMPPILFVKFYTFVVTFGFYDAQFSQGCYRLDKLSISTLFSMDFFSFAKVSTVTQK